MSNPKFFDVHTHVQFTAFSEDTDAVIRRALDAGVWIVNVGTQRDTSKKAIEFANQYPEGVYATVGLHPIHTEASYHDSKELGGDGAFTSRGEEFDYEYYKKLAYDSKVVAIGECGLDYYRLDINTKEKQKHALLPQIELSHDVKKPLMIHCRQAFDDLIALFEENREMLLASPGIVHFFSGTKEDAQRLLDFGFSFSFGGVLTFTHDYNEVVRYIPLDRILLETDAPYVAPVPYRGKRNEPFYIGEVAAQLAAIKGIETATVSRRTTENALKIFGLSPK